MSESLDENYAAGGFGRGLQPGRRPALLIIDFVRAYLVPGSPLYAGAESARAAARTLLEAARRARIPVVHTNVALPGRRPRRRRLLPQGARHCSASRRARTPSSPRSPQASSPPPAKR